jgi:uncharacterized protein YegL
MVKRGGAMEDKIAKQKLNLIVLVDCSKSMQGERIAQVNKALRDIKTHLVEMQGENSGVDFFMTVITFSTEARFVNGDRCKAVEEFDFQNLKGGGWSNLHLGYQKLEEILKKESRGGIMPDFGGVAPIILLMTDGHPTKYPLTEEMAALKKLPWYKVALKYGIAIELKDERTHKVLQEFVNGNGDVIECYDSKLLEKIIKIIVLTASKVKSTSISVAAVKGVSVKNEIQQKVGQALAEVDDWEW